MRRPVVALALAVLLVLAGCETGPAPDPTVTDSLPDPEVYPPGLVSNGVASPTALADAHEAALSNASYATTGSVTAWHEGEVAWRQTTTERVASGHDTVLAAVNLTGHLPGTPAWDYTAWINNSTRLYRFDTDSGATYIQPETTGPFTAGHHSRLYSLYLALSFDVQRTQEGFVLVATGVRESDPVSWRFENETNVSLTVRLDERGRLRSYRLAFDGTRRGVEYRVVQTLRFADVGQVTVERPPWVDEGLNRSG